MLSLHDPAPSPDPDASGEHASPPRPASYLGRGLVAWTRLCLWQPWAVVLLAVVSALASGYWTAGRLGYKVSRVDLLDQESDTNKLWIDYIREFGEDDDAVLVVEGESRGDVIAVLEELSREVAEDEALFRSVLHEVDLSQIRAKGLHYLSPADLAAIDRFIERTEPILDGGWAQLRVGTMVAGMAGQMVTGGAAEEPNGEPPALALERCSESLLAGLESPTLVPGPGPEYLSPWPSMPE